MAVRSKKGAKSGFHASVARRHKSISSRLSPGRAAISANAVKLPIAFPANLSISTPGFEELETFLIKFRKSNIDNIIPSGAMRAAVQGIAQGIRKNFETKQGPDGPWAPLEPSTARYRARQGYPPYGEDLVRGGSLKKAIDQFDILVAKSNESGASHKYTGSIRPNPQIRNKTKTTKSGKRAKQSEMNKPYKTPRTTVQIIYGTNEISNDRVTKSAEIKISGPSVALNNGYSMHTKKGTRHVPARPFWYVSDHGRQQMQILVKAYLAGHMTRDVKKMLDEIKRSKSELHELGTQENKSVFAMRSIDKSRRKAAFIELYHASLRGRGLMDENGKVLSAGWRSKTREAQVTSPDELLDVSGVISLRKQIAQGTFLHVPKVRGAIESYIDAPSGTVIHRYRVKVVRGGKTVVEYKSINLTDWRKARRGIDEYERHLKAGEVVGIKLSGRNIEFTAPTSLLSETVPLIVVMRGLRKARPKTTYTGTAGEEQEKAYYGKLAITVLKAQIAEAKRLRANQPRSTEYTGGVTVKREYRVAERHDVANAAYNFRISPTRISGTALGIEEGGKYHPLQRRKVSQEEARKSTIDEALEIIMGRKMTSDNELIAEALGRRGRDFGDAIVAIREEIARRQLNLERQYAGNREILARIRSIPINERYDAFVAPDGTIIVSSNTGLETTSRGGWSSRTTRHTMAVRMTEFLPENVQPSVQRAIQEMFGHWDQEFLGTYKAESRYGKSGRAPGELYHGAGRPVKVVNYDKRIWEDWQKERNRIIWMQRTLRVMEYFAQRSWEEMYYRNVEIRIKHEMGMYYESLDFNARNAPFDGIGHPYAKSDQARARLADIIKRINDEEQERDDAWSAIAGERVYGPRFMSRRRELGWLMNYEDFNNVFWNGYLYRMNTDERAKLIGLDGIGISERMTTPVEGRAYRDKNGQWYSVNRAHINWYDASRNVWGASVEDAIRGGIIDKNGNIISADVPIYIRVAEELKDGALSTWGTESRIVHLTQAWTSMTEQDMMRDELGRVTAIKRQKGTFGGVDKRPSWWAGSARKVQKTNPELFSRSGIGKSQGYNIVPYGSYQMQAEARKDEQAVIRKGFADAFQDTFTRYGWLITDELADPRKFLRTRGLRGQRVEEYLYGHQGSRTRKPLKPRAESSVPRDENGRLLNSYSIDELRTMLSEVNLGLTSSRKYYFALVAYIQQREAEVAEKDREADGGSTYMQKVAKKERRSRSTRSKR